MTAWYGTIPFVMSPQRDDSADRILFDSGLVRVGAFRCAPTHPSFRECGAPAGNYCFVFPRTAVEIQHEHERAFVANPNVVTFYNRGQEYRRSAISAAGDRCDWFGLDAEIVRDVVRPFEPSVDDRPEAPFRLTRGFSDPRTYLLQRQLFDRAGIGIDEEPLAIEETVVFLLERVVRSAYRSRPSADQGLVEKQRDIVHQAEIVLSASWDEPLHLRDVAAAIGASVFHLCRTFRRATGTTLHHYRHNLRVRHALEAVRESDAPIVEIALTSGFSSHSHFTSSFHEEFGYAPSMLRVRTFRSS